MTQAISIKLNRVDNSPWGFRLQGGKDFGQPLLIQKVNGGSIAERAGLQVGDALIRVNNTDVSNMRHKEAQDTIVRGGNSLELSVQRGGGSTWKPQVSPVGQVPLPGKSSPLTTVTKTSLAAKHTPPAPIGSGHNLTPKPFGGVQVNGDTSVKAIVNKQYNTPVQMYSEEVIAETLSAQAEVLAGGAIGVNFLKNEKTYDSQKSEVFKILQEVEKEPHELDQPDTRSATPVSSLPSGLRHVQPPEPKPAPTSPQPQSLPPGQNICTDCERLIVGVFVRIKDKNLHVECFKCSTCGSSLKNVGYYNINNKLYCEIHAKMAARQNAPAPNLEPVTVPPGGRVPAGAFSSPLSTAAPSSPQPGTLAPLPFHTSAPSGPKPFSSVSAPSVPSSVPFTPSAAPIAPPTSTPFSSSIPPPPPPSSFSKPSSGFPSPQPNKNLSRGGGGVGGRGTLPGTSAPKRGRGVLNQGVLPGGRVPLCGHCNIQIRGPFITALGKIWCPEHFVCVNAKCKRPLQDIGFVEEQDGLYCEFCFEQYLAPSCDKCRGKIKGDCLNAIGKHFHPECFSCAYCGKLFGNNPFFLEDALPYCENDWNELFTTKCFSCGFPIEAGDRWVEALSNNYHSQCFNCTMCKKNLEGQSFFAKAGRPFCKNHAR